MIRKLILLTLSTTLIFIYSCSGKSKVNEDEKQNPIKKEFSDNIKTTKAVLSNPEKEITLTGMVTSDPDKTVNYVPLVSGVIERTYFSLGDKVQKGQTLLDIRSTDLSALQSELISLDTEFKITQRDLASQQALFDDNMLSEKELLEAKGRVKQAEAALKKVQADMSVFGADKGNGIFSIKAPVSGYITSKNATSGGTVSSAGEPLFTITDLNTVWIIVNVYAGNLLLVKEGMEANITTLSYPDEVFKGKISNLSQVFDPEDKTLKARIVLANKDLKFKPEMSVVVILKNESHKSLVTIPSDALIFDNDKYFAIVEGKEKNYEIREITPYGHNNALTYITSGISEGENVVIKNQLLIYSELKGK